MYSQESGPLPGEEKDLEDTDSSVPNRSALSTPHSAQSPRFDNNLVSFQLGSLCQPFLAKAMYFRECGPLEEEKDVEEIFVSGQRSCVEFNIDLQRRYLTGPV